MGSGRVKNVHCATRPRPPRFSLLAATIAPFIITLRLTHCTSEIEWYCTTSDERVEGAWPLCVSKLCDTIRQSNLKVLLGFSNSEIVS